MSNSYKVNRCDSIKAKNMKKVLKIIGITLSVVVITGVILSLVAPKKISVTNTQFVKASKQAVFDQLRFMKNFPNWSPFIKQDPEQQFSISGTDGTVGATYSWVGVKEKSKGAQKIVSISGLDKIVIACTITEPFQSNPTFAYTLTEKNEGVEIVQQFDTDMPIPANVIGMLMGLKTEITNTNKQGLALLKKAVEK